MNNFEEIIIPSKLKKYYNDIIIRKYTSGKRTMQFDNENDVYQSIYNINDLDKFYLPYMSLIILSFNYVDVINTCLIIGLGGGHLPIFIRSILPNCKIDAVELDMDVYIGAQKMGFAEDTNMNVYIENGSYFINQSLNKYDIIVIDLDDESSYDNFDFYKIKKNINQNGILAINVFTDNNKTYLQQKLKKHFSLIKHFRIDSNHIFLCKLTNDIFEKMIDDITLETLPPILNQYKYKNELINIVNKSNISVILN